MAGFIICTLSVLFTAWIVWVVSYKAGHLDGYLAAQADVKSGIVPAGTQPCHPQDCDNDCPHSVLRVRASRADCFPPGCNDFPECDHRY